MNPGHAIEAGWFLLDACKDPIEGVDMKTLITKAEKVIEMAFVNGWDGDTGHGQMGNPVTHATKDKNLALSQGVCKGGMIYFQDVLGLTPSQLEWNMKLWWPQAETMISYAKLFVLSNKQDHLDRLKLATDWTYNHLVDS